MNTSGPVLFVYLVFGIFALLFSAALAFLLTRKNKKLWHWLLSSASALALLVCFAGVGGTFLLSGKLGTNRIGAKTELSYRSLPDDVQRNIADHKGKVIVLNLWATWCGPCRAEMPDLDRIQRDYKDKGVVVLTISDEDRKTVMEYWNKHNFSMQPGYVELEKTPLFKGIPVRPVTFIIDREGVIRKRMMGPRQYQEFAEAIRKHL